MARASYVDWDEDDSLDLPEDEPRSHARRRLPWLRMMVLSGLSVAGLVYLARQGGGPPSSTAGPVPAPVLLAPPPVWTPLDAPALFGIGKAAAPIAASARRHESGAREDTLVLGRFGDPGHGRISLVQGLMDRTRHSFFVDVARRAAEAGLAVTRNGRSHMVASKFGPVEMAEVTLAGAGEQDCQAFRFGDPEAAFGFQGWLCGAGSNAAEAACLIDRVSLEGAEDITLKALFARAAHNPSDACALADRTASAVVRPPARR